MLTATCGLAAVLLWVCVQEFMTFERQARWLASIGAEISYQPEPGLSPSVRFPEVGESDRRLGYTQLPRSVERLQAAGYEVEAQARWSPRLQQVVELGLNAPYQRKHAAGLVVRDRQGIALHDGRYPRVTYREFGEIPPVVVDTLLFIENRELLDENHPHRNPAIEWDRLAHSLTVKAMTLAGSERKTPGASTLATQLEKYHHSPGGLTQSAGEKLRQMLSASLRAYLDGADTVETRQRIVTEYLNTVPLAAAPRIGEIHGLGPGLHAWFGADFERVNALLAKPDSEEAAVAYRQLLSLLIAQRRPSYYLLEDRAALADMTDSYLRLLGRSGTIPGSLLEAASSVSVTWQRPTAPARIPFPERKWSYFVRARLTELLEVPKLYDLDRLDLSVTTTIDATAQARVTELLRGLADPVRARELGLTEHRLLGQQDPSAVTYSVTLVEHAAGANLVRVQADNADRPLDINRGVKLDLGSTAKLRTLVIYLETIAALHQRYAHLAAAELQAERQARADRLGIWVIDSLLAQPRQELLELLEAAMERRYSASPNQAFFTGGGRHVFSNFDRQDDGRTVSVSDAFNRSVNLPFIRMMADVVAYYQAEMPYSSQRLLDQADAPSREQYLARFADQEGTEYLRRFFTEYAGLTPAEILDRVLSKSRRSAGGMATVLASVDPAATAEALADQLAARLDAGPESTDRLAGLLVRHGPESLTLADRGYVARIHPLELWLAAKLFADPDASLSDVLNDSREVRQQVYRWLFKTRNKRAQDRRIATLLEQEAFLDIHAFWQRLGYPFDRLVPSLATAIGSSADHPAALTELLGIVANGGKRYPTVYATQLNFAEGTPFETRMRLAHAPPEGVLAPEVAAVTRAALQGVVSTGTARRLNRLSPLLASTVGGKTGTGDHRYQRYGSGGQLIESRVVNRSAVFTFVIGERFFGTVTAFVPGAQAADHQFTSALPVQVLGHLLPLLQPLLEAPPELQDGPQPRWVGGLQLAAAGSTGDGEELAVGAGESARAAMLR
ncbi:MAG: transglycosylase domain-containing protein [Pseudomonadales bacterium]